MCYTPIMRILGIDPGIGICGYSIIDLKGDGYTLVSSGAIKTDKDSSMGSRLLEIFNDICEICDKFKPDCASVEQIFFFKNQKTIIPVVQARGAILCALEKMNVAANEYTPMQVKLTVTGHGRASKDEVKVMVEKFVTIGQNIKLDDTIDSIAIAITHARNLSLKQHI